MSSEIIVVLVLVVLAIAFVIWVRVNSQEHSRVLQEPEPERPAVGADARMRKPDQADVRPRSKQR
jgi:flagellar basal body-associated protein FliL